MHDIEPFYGWQHIYNSEEDEESPFHTSFHSEFMYTNKVYNYYIHPQWDYFGSETLYLKVLFVDYEMGEAVIEFIGEWNDALYNDIMTLKRNVIDEMIRSGIKYFILITESVMNFHYSDECYYEEWMEEIEEGFIVMINPPTHIIRELQKAHIDNYILIGEPYLEFEWRKMQPKHLFIQVKESLRKILP